MSREESVEYRIYRKNEKGQYEYLCTGDGARWVSDPQNARAEITNEIRNPVDRNRDHQLVIGDIFWLAGEYYMFERTSCGWYTSFTKVGPDREFIREYRYIGSELWSLYFVHSDGSYSEVGQNCKRHKIEKSDLPLSLRSA
jgi:hypothetical protein